MNRYRPELNLVFGEAIGKGDSLNLHFLPVGGSGDFRQHAFKLETGLLEGDFREAMGAQLQAVALATVKPATHESGKYLVETLRPAAVRLEHLIHFPPSGLSAGQLADVQFALGLALSIIGEQAGDKKALTEAVAAYRAALEGRTRERVPLQWAQTQNGLGIVLEHLGDREHGTARLEEAVAAYRAALEEYTRERVPLDWAKTQNNLGGALLSLADRGGGPWATPRERIEEAVAAYRAALEEYTRERVPLLWAIAQNNLGTALESRGWYGGEGVSQTGLLEEAVAAHRAALEEFTRERVPLLWAMAQIDLGSALSTLGKWEGKSGTGRLEEAVAAYRAALNEFTRERVPLNWAKTQYSLGVALESLGELESGTARLEQAVAAYREALKEMTPEAAPYLHDTAQETLARCLASLEQRRKP